MENLKKTYKATYKLNGITERTDLLVMENNDVESAINAIQELFAGTWGFDPNAIEVKQIIPGHYEQIKSNLPCRCNSKAKVWVADEI